MVKKFVLMLSLIAAAATARAATIEMQVHGLVCSFCAQGIEKVLRKNAATADVLVSLEDRLVAVTTKEGRDIADAELRKALTDAGYDVKGIQRTDTSLATLRARIKSKGK